MGLYEWLMQLHESDPEEHDVDWEALPGGAAVGADLATLQRLVAVVREREGAPVPRHRARWSPACAPWRAAPRLTPLPRCAGCRRRPWSTS